MTDTEYAQNDTVPLNSYLPDDLSDGVSVSLRLKETDGTEIFTNTGDIKDGAEGLVSYEWSAGETDRTGLHFIRWVVDWSDGTTETYPKEDPDTIYFTEE